MKRTCLICHAVFEPQDDDPSVAHWICPSCSQRLLGLGGARTLGEFLDQIAVPVLVMDDEVRVAGYNEAARALLDGERRELTGRLAGEVFDCENALLPGGCGQTEHCKACALREAILITHQTGQSQHRTLGKPREKRIRTEKFGSFVLLRLEGV